MRIRVIKPFAAPEQSWVFYHTPSPPYRLGAALFSSGIEAATEVPDICTIDAADRAPADAKPALKAQLEPELAVEEDRISSDDLDDIRYWPVSNVGVAYHF
ncbi:MAG: hypothetical protein KUF72_02555 [Candidatus Thiodiazotropha sp. (ex Ctena orbiculata)]|nr:hypothetical protein [Candidatus Thiodiazotropha taylori]